MTTSVTSELAKLLIQKEYNLHVDFKDSYPTIAEVVMWLYEKHEIWIEVNHIKTFGINRFHITIWNYKDTSDYITIYHDDIGPGYKVWDTPTEAYLAAIEYTLNNLIYDTRRIYTTTTNK
jgi:hypothetical protein